MAHPAAPPAVPAPVRRSYLCWLVATAVYVVSTAVLLLFSFGVTDQALSGSGLPPEAGVFFTVVLIGVGVVVLVFAVLTVWFAIRMRAGRSWARITLTVFGGIFALVNLIGVFGNNGLTLNGQDIDSGTGAVVGIVSAAVTLALVVAALVLQWLPAAGPHFARPVPGFPPPPPYGAAPW